MAWKRTLVDAMFSNIVPVKRTGSCGMTAVHERALASPIWSTSTPSMLMQPLSASTNRKSASMSVSIAHGSVQSPKALERTTVAPHEAKLVRITKA